MKKIILLGVVMTVYGCDYEVTSEPISDKRLDQWAGAHQVSAPKRDAVKRYLKSYVHGKDIASRISDPDARARALADWDRQAHRAARTLGTETAEVLSEVGGPDVGAKP